jgi:Ribbon-helix-helix protein, copG family
MLYDSMAKESRDAVISVRISEEDQARLRALAAARGTSVSELVRSIVLREVSTPEPVTTTHPATDRGGPRGTTTAAARAPSADQGVFWSEQDRGRATVAGATITLRFAPAVLPGPDSPPRDQPPG